jgi:2-oxoglutarate dehydrogenase E1 component/2-oxoglutarate decarboxylase
VAWEAQFGDFVVGGQTIVDEFIASGDAKWGQRSGVVLLLPHSYEGQGPDHSSARIERFLDLCAQGNMTVAQPSTPANYFHLLRRHAKSAEHRPLVVFTPKSLLRAKAATSPAQEFSEGRWRPVLDDPGTPSRPVRRVVLCSGKMYYDLAKARSKQGVDDIALVRVEQFYPMPEDEIVEVLEHYGDATDIVWAQEEPANMGAWDHMALGLPQHLEGARKLRRVSRPPAAAPAAGSMRTHDAEQQRVITNALARR